MMMPASAQIVLSKNKGHTFTVTLVENPSVGKWSISTTNGLQIVSNTYKNSFRTVTLKAKKSGLQTVDGTYKGKSGNVIDRLSKAVNVI
jgi:predicted secreted protein